MLVIVQRDPGATAAITFVRGAATRTVDVAVHPADR
jgi:hypothetical protein